MSDYKIYITPAWDGTYSIEESKPQGDTEYNIVDVVATGFRTISDAKERVRFMGREHLIFGNDSTVQDNK